MATVAARAAEAADPDTPADVLAALAADRSAVVRWNVLVHNPERLDLAALIAEDTDEMNAQQARSQLEDRVGSPPSSVTST